MPLIRGVYSTLPNIYDEDSTLPNIYDEDFMLNSSWLLTSLSTHFMPLGVPS